MRPLKANYKHLFFDLDHTLWDYTTNSEETLKELYQKYSLEQLGSFCLNSFCQTFDAVNRELWFLNESGKLGRDELRRRRFALVLEQLGVRLAESEIASQLDQDYMLICPAKPGLLPHARQVLDHFWGRQPMYVLTNGFRDVQEVKLRAAGIAHYFTGIFTSEDAGAAKPNPIFFEHVLKQIDARPEQCLMIGDNLKADIIGATSAGIDSIYYNPHRRRFNLPVQCEIHCLSELLRMF